MKNNIRNRMKILIGIFGLAILLVSCEYKTEYQSANYPDQLIYMPAAYSGNFVINDISRKRGDLPFDGEPFRYVVDLDGGKFNVPLGVYRSGINNDGAFSVDIAVNTDTITKLIAAGKLVNTVLLGADKYTVINSVNMPDGKEIVSFNLVVNLDSLRQNYQKNTIFALGIGISSTQRKTNPKLGTTIVVIDTKIMKPTADFTWAADATNPKKIIFTNISKMADVYSWSFGDGSVASAVASPSNIYAAAGTYTVTLQATGLTGALDKSTKTVTITVL